MVLKPRYWFLASAAVLSVPYAIQTVQRRVIMGSSTSSANDTFPVQKSDEEWRAVLNPQQVHTPRSFGVDTDKVQFRILREKGTEMAGSGMYDHFDKTGVFDCAACGTPLYTSSSKFNSGCGWPAFAEAYVPALTHRFKALTAQYPRRD
jgi:peptide-methionine (R)-S-oxide reductase